jgi:DinB superfamily
MGDAQAPTGAPWLAVSEDDYLWYVDLALDEMVAIVSALGDGTANRRPDLAGANSPYAILTHCLGVLEFWGGLMVAERAITRDREAEFAAQGAGADLARRAATARRQLATDISGFDASAAPPQVLPPEDSDLPYAKTKGGVLLHVLEELLQHLGQMELSRDVLLSEG